MLDDKEFDLWADTYDQSVSISDEENTYPFAGYKKLLARIYQVIRQEKGKKVLDIGFGTATLCNKLYQDAYDIWGQDFSKKMLDTASKKMPKAHLFQGDFTQGLHEEISKNTYDFILATYSLHHLPDEKKISLIRYLETLLNPNGLIIIGDIAFQTQKELESCKKKAADTWDEEEFYFLYERMKKDIMGLSFDKVSDCAGILQLRK